MNFMLIFWELSDTKFNSGTQVPKANKILNKWIWVRENTVIQRAHFVIEGIKSIYVNQGLDITTDLLKQLKY